MTRVALAVLALALPTAVASGCELVAAGAFGDWGLDDSGWEDDWTWDDGWGAGDASGRGLRVSSVGLDGDLGGATSYAGRGGSGDGYASDYGGGSVEVWAQGPRGAAMAIFETYDGVPFVALAPGVYTFRGYADGVDVTGCAGSQLYDWDVDTSADVVTIEVTAVPEAPGSVAVAFDATFTPLEAGGAEQHLTGTFVVTDDGATVAE
ncbi:MAG: hypothetical protein KC635_01620 [Myxococcales bacterium]|nr:hypothetical protein [Myxococcales bacterium]MCB9737326.1 hypothetical protein [Deltaproteobacteria bacterium]